MKNFNYIIWCVWALVGLFGCGSKALPNQTTGGVSCPGDDSTMSRPVGWTLKSHCRGVGVDYNLLFSDTVVHRFDIIITPQVYQQTMDNLSDIMVGPPQDRYDPMWVPVTIKFNGLTWEQVGMRYKGNSSLNSAWRDGVRKLAFRLNFDKYEDTHPELKNQRFYGFKKMIFSNGFKDLSLIREKLAADLFRDHGVPAARGAFARVHVDYGSGPIYYGLYTMIEDPSDEMLESQFSDKGGNLYKPEGEGAKWGRFIEAHFEKTSNEESSDWSDVQAAITTLNAARGDAAAWRSGLEAVFNTGVFLKWLAMNQAMVNWDTYGFMSHNYYIYGDPSDSGRLVWIPWDLNEAMILQGAHAANAGSVMLDEISSDWPLIRFLLDDPVYRQAYIDELKALLSGAFELTRVKSKMDAYHALVAPYAVGTGGEAAPYTFLKRAADFENSLTTGRDALKTHVEARHQAIRQALGL